MNASQCVSSAWILLDDEMWCRYKSPRHFKTNSHGKLVNFSYSQGNTCSVERYTEAAAAAACAATAAYNQHMARHWGFIHCDLVGKGYGKGWSPRVSTGETLVVCAHWTLAFLGASCKAILFIFPHRFFLRSLHLPRMHMQVSIIQINGHFRNLNWRYLPYIRPI